MNLHNTIHHVWLGATVLVILMLGADSLMAHDWVAPKEEAKVRNPVAMDQASINSGRRTFLEFCAYCHGQNAQGLSAKEAQLKKGSPNLVEGLTTEHSEGDFHWKILNGKEEMPSFHDDLSDKEIWDIINYIKSLK